MGKMTLSQDLREVGVRTSGSLGEEGFHQEESSKGPEAAVGCVLEAARRLGRLK